MGLSIYLDSSRYQVGFEIIPRIFAQHMNATVMYRPASKLWLNELMLKSH
jgi:hypothetical protein